MNVMIIDDSTEILFRLASLIYKLEDVNIVGKAYDGPSALKMISLLKPDAIILDIKLPGMNGMKVLQKVKESFPGTVVIMFTNSHSGAYRKKCAELGCDYFFDKSTEFDLLTGTLSILSKEFKEKKRNIP